MAIRRGRRRPVTPVMDLWVFAVFRMQVDANAVSCAATLHHAVSISPHAVTRAALSDFTLGFGLRDVLLLSCTFRRSAGVRSTVRFCRRACEGVSSLSRLVRDIYRLFVRRITAFWSPSSILGFKHTPASPRVDSLSQDLNSEPAGFPSPCENRLTDRPAPCAAPARLRWRWGTSFYGAIRLVRLGQILFLRLAYTFLLQMVYIPRRGSRPKSAGSSVQLGQGGNLVISPLHRRFMKSKVR